MATKLESADIVVITVNRNEADAVEEALREMGAQRSATFGESREPYDYWGEINGQHIVHVRSNMGSTLSGASRDTTRRAIKDLSPKLLLAVGVAWGAKETDGQDIGHVLIASQVQLGAPVKFADAATVPRGPRPELVTTAIKQLTATREHYLSDTTIHKGTVLSEEALFDNLEERNRRLATYPEIIGGEMEAAGIYQGIRDEDSNTEWLVVKGICDWGYKKSVDPAAKEGNQKLAARAAARLCAHAIKHFPLVKQSGGEAKHSVKAPPSPGDTAKKAPSQLENVLRSSDPAHFLLALSSADLNIEVFGQGEPRAGSFVYWPVRIRRPNVVHAAQTCIAAGLKKRGFDVRLCFDDLGNPEGYPSIQDGIKELSAAVRKWAFRATSDAAIADDLVKGIRFFSEFVGDRYSRSPRPGALEMLGDNLVKWLLSEEQLRAVLSQSKLLKNENEAALESRPRKLLSPAVAWTVLELLAKESSSKNSVVTLGGEDERQIWVALPKKQDLPVKSVLLPKVRGDMDSEGLRPNSKNSIQAIIQEDSGIRSWLIRYAWHLPELTADKLSISLDEKLVASSSLAAERIQEFYL